MVIICKLWFIVRFSQKKFIKILVRENKLKRKFPTSILSSWLITKFLCFSFSNFWIEMKPKKIKHFKTKILWLNSPQLCGRCFFFIFKIFFYFEFLNRFEMISTKCFHSGLKMNRPSCLTRLILSFVLFLLFSDWLGKKAFFGNSEK